MRLTILAIFLSVAPALLIPGPTVVLAADAPAAPATQPAPRPTVFVEFYTASGRNSKDSTYPLTGLENGFREVGLNPDWWRQELENVTTARIDVLNLIGGQVVRSNQYNRFAVMLDVMRERQKAGKANPKVAMFYDGMGFNAFRGANLDTDAGMAEFYKWIKTFFDFFITQQNARDALYEYDGAFPVFVYHPEPRCGVTCVQDKLVPYVKEQFEKDFPGCKVYLIFSELYRNGEYTNNHLKLTNADNYFNWGASFGGIASPDTGKGFNITTIGPGFDDRNRTDQRQEGWGVRVRERRDGALFRQEFQRAIRVRDRSPWLVLETWNLFIEGSEVAVSKNFGDKSVQVCREMIPLFKQPMTDAERRQRDAFRPDGSVAILGPDTSPDVLVNENHFICDWLVLGPLPLPEDQRTDESARAAVADLPLDPAILSPKLGAEALGQHWQVYHNPNELVPEVVRLASMFGETNYTCAYVASEVIAPQAMTCKLLVSTDDYGRVFVNGQSVYAFDKEARGAVPDSDKVEQPIQLKAGSNWIVFKIVNLHGGWGAVARLTTADGTALRMQR